MNKALYFPQILHENTHLYGTCICLLGRVLNLVFTSVNTYNIFLLLISSMLHVDLKKWLSHPFKCEGQGPHIGANKEKYTQEDPRFCPNL